MAYGTEEKKFNSSMSTEITRPLGEERNKNQLILFAEIEGSFHG